MTGSLTRRDPAKDPLAFEPCLTSSWTTEAPLDRHAAVPRPPASDETEHGRARPASGAAFRPKAEVKRGCGNSNREPRPAMTGGGALFPREAGARRRPRDTAAQQEQVWWRRRARATEVLNLSSARRDRGALAVSRWRTSGPLGSGAGCRRGLGTARRSPRGTPARPRRTRRRATSAPRTTREYRRSRS
jgi:hypothetical protein